MFAEPMFGFALFLYLFGKSVDCRALDNSEDAHHFLNVFCGVSKYQSPIINTKFIEVAEKVNPVRG